MINIKKIDLKNFEDLQEKAKIIIAFDFFKEAFELSQRLEKEIKEKSEFQNSQYYDILYKLKWVALPKLKDGEVKEMFASHFMVIFKIAGFNIWNKLKSKIINDIFYDERNNFKNKIKKILLDNEEIITSKRIFVNQKIVNPSIANWLRDYNINVGSEFINKEEQTQYLTYSENIKKIDNLEEKEKLKTLFKIYEKLKISSLTSAGIEEDIYTEDEDGNKGVLSEGMFTKINDITKKQIELMGKIISGEPIDEKDKVAIQPIGEEDKKVSEKIAETKDMAPIEIKTLKQEKEITGGDVFFDKSDDKEIKELKVETDELKNSAGAQGTDLNLESEEIIKKLNLPMSSFLSARFKNIIISARKGIRDKIGIKEVLRRSVENGGMGMAEKIIDQILMEIKSQKPIKFIKSVKSKVYKAHKVESEKEVESQEFPPKADHPLDEGIMEKKNIELLANKKDNFLKNNVAIEKIAPPPPVRISEVGFQKSEVRSQKSEVKVKDVKEKREAGNQEEVKGMSKEKEIDRKNVLSEIEGLKISPERSQIIKGDHEAEKKQGFFGKLFGSGKEKIKENIRAKNIISGSNEIAASAIASSQRQMANNEKPKLVGPIEELEYLSIEDFRNWSKDPMKAIKKIEEKIAVAGEKFLEKRILGIKAWKKSEINKLYLEILNDGLIKHKQTEEIIEEREKERKTVLSKDEFEAIMELNRRLRF
ncbi:hypothetical protein KAI52_02455 [Candidatus Parcubacteria bacterium]|nr:hypothetical protein [Candidatus Parcubacteria bacterium]